MAVCVCVSSSCILSFAFHLYLHNALTQVYVHRRYQVKPSVYRLPFLSFFFSSFLLCAFFLRYYAKAFKKDIPQCVDILSDILMNSTIDEDAVQMEKHVILREMEEVEKQTEEVIFDRLHTTVRTPENVMRSTARKVEESRLIPLPPSRWPLLLWNEEEKGALCIDEKAFILLSFFLLFLSMFSQESVHIHVFFLAAVGIVVKESKSRDKKGGLYPYLSLCI